MSKSFRVAIVGATGAVGKVMLEVLEQRKFPVGELVPLASARSKGKEVKFGNRSYACRELTPEVFKDVDFAFFDASDEISKQWVPVAARSGAWVIDNSATYRLDSSTPLVVPEVNEKALENFCHNLKLGSPRVISGPNCTTAQLVVALSPLHQSFGLKRVVISTYQSVSGAGSLALDELRDQTQAALRGESLKAEVLAHPIAFNCIPHIGGFKPDGSTSEELKVIQETRKILGISDLRMSVTAVRVPAEWCHGESINIEFEKPYDLKELKNILSRQKGLVVEDDPTEKRYPLNRLAVGEDPVFVGRIRRDESVESGVNLWIVADNLRKGAALNAVQIAEQVMRYVHS